MADINQKNSSNRFVNPYNFIHLPEEKAMAYGETDRHTGVIHYTITTKTPLFVPNSSSETAFKESEDTPDHKSYVFFSYTELDEKKRYEGKENYLRRVCRKGFWLVPCIVCYDPGRHQ